ncbi:SRPBCC family protein [Nocardia mangyaensis]|uniref:SRPBCC family protein n=1 Tax=Nocardia mangyaensis TaxID=2213200 RepID=UPI0026745490|nr:SRPBCC family protein [Nocardia mangyaensis]MDO3646230.1 SRPBCC family protein [Nocardia mangyaensis]
MSRTMTVTDSIVVAADPLSVYQQVSDPTLMGRWSPENRGAEVAQPRESTYVGMEFDGFNKRGAARWVTRCVVIAADPGQRFAFRVEAIGVRRPWLRGRIATWEYRFEPVGGGTRVTETWHDDRARWPNAAVQVFDRIATGGDTFVEFQRKNIHRTLRNLERKLGSTN